MCAVSSHAQNVSLPQSETETKGIISAKGQLTDVPTVYVWMLDAELNSKQTKPVEYVAESGDKNDNYYMIKMQGGSSYDTPISNNIIAANPTLTDNAAILPNYTRYESKSEQYRLARIKVVDGTGSMKVRDELTTIRGRGNSTWWCDKKPYRLKFPSKTKLLAKADGTNDYADAKNWVLLANAADKTMLRNALTREVGLRIAEKTGLQALPYYPAYRFVDLVVNDVYVGTYQISDHTQILKGRINIDADNGWFLEGVMGNAFLEEPYIEMGSGMKYTVNVKNPEDDFYTPEVEQAIKDYLNRIDLCMQQWGEGANDYSEETGLFKYVDQDILNALCQAGSGFLPSCWNVLIPTPENCRGGCVLHLVGVGRCFNVPYVGSVLQYHYWEHVAKGRSFRRPWSLPFYLRDWMIWLLLPFSSAFFRDRVQRYFAYRWLLGKMGADTVFLKKA